MALPEAQRRMFKDQAKTIMSSVEDMESGLADLVAAKDKTETDFKEKMAEHNESIASMRDERREHQEAANSLMAMAGEEAPYDIPKHRAGRHGDYTKPSKGKVERTCPKCKTVVYVGKARNSCPVLSCDGKLPGEGKKTAGQGKLYRECPACGTVSAVGASAKRCPVIGCDGKLDRSYVAEPPEGDEGDENDENDENDEDDDPEPDPANDEPDLPDDDSDVDMPGLAGKEPWEVPCKGRVDMKCVRCQRVVYVSPGAEVCPDDACRGKLYGSDPTPPPYRGGKPKGPVKKSQPGPKTPRKSPAPVANLASPVKPVPVAWDPEPWRHKTPETVGKGCRRCEEKVFVLPHLTTCPRDGCGGDLVNAK